MDQAETQRYKLHDERALYLSVTPEGGKWWRPRYRAEWEREGEGLCSTLRSQQSTPSMSLAMHRAQSNSPPSLFRLPICG